ncbi:DMT family transporter [Bacillus alkalicellulosilyticus]|uniref:DMT family transporter n=1 Tax=Alkalihalobacterium alkalicellulosilyticum TaxID=1912214 RepID=UPI000998AE00|nr:DMT family transporter [Bacillus alkalicellulosilyticus]
MDKRVAYTLIALGATLWGMIGFFVQRLYDYELTPLQVTTIRVTSAAMILVLFSLIKNRNWLIVNVKDSHYFVGTGILSIVFFNWCFFAAIQETSISVAAILLYTGPAFVTILSRIFFKEWFTIRKVTSLAVTLVGCSFVIGFLPTIDSTISLYGLIVGLGSGLGYALYSIFGKVALRKYHPMTVTNYTFIYAALFLLPLSQLWTVPHIFSIPAVWVYGIGLGFLPTVLAFILYTRGLHEVESSRASIIATIEPVVAVLIGVLLFQEVLTSWQTVGIVMVIAAVIIVQEKAKHSEKEAVKKAV